MPNWKKVIVSGSDAVVNSIKIPLIHSNGSVSTGTNVVTIDSTGQLYMTGSYGNAGGGGSGTVFEKVNSPSGTADICSFRPAFGTNTLSTQNCTTGGRGCNSILYGDNNIVNQARNTVGGFENKISSSVADDLSTNKNFSQFNTVFGGQCNTILAGTGETGCNSSNNTIIGGCNSTISAPSCCTTLIGGYSNILGKLNSNSTLVGGISNKISGSTGSSTKTVLIGTCNALITGSSHTDIGSINLVVSGSDGAFNTTLTKNNATIHTCRTHLGPFNDTTTECASVLQCSVVVGVDCAQIKGGAHQTMIGGKCNEIFANCANSNCGFDSIIGARNSKIHHSVHSAILGGHTNTITGSISLTHNCYNQILGGCNSCISDSCFSSIINSCDAKVCRGFVSHVIGTRQSCISGSQYSMVVGGFQNCISGSSSDQFNIIGGGCNSIIKGGSGNVVIGGSANHIGITGTSTCSTVLGGYNHDINSSTNSQTLGGHTNCIQDGVRSSIIGGCANTFTDSTNAHAIGLTNVSIADAENTLYAYNICAYGTNGNNGTICAKAGCFSNIGGRSPLSISTGTDFLSITSSNFNVASTGEMSSGTGDGISTTNITASSNISSSGTITANNFVGDGSNLTGVSDFPLTASLVAIISRSFSSGDTDSTALRLLGSGSVSQSGIFEVEGSAGPLFSVADGLDGILMEVNNISGLPLFQVSSSNEVFINRGNLTSGVTTATASFAHFTGSFKGDGSGLTNLPAGSTPTLAQVVTAGASAAGDVQITGSLTITGSLVSIGIQNQADVTNTVMGPGAGGTSMNWNGTSTFGENILIGSGSGKSLTISKQNTFIGNLTGTSAGAGVNHNTLVGYKAGNRLYVGSYNTFVGTNAGSAALINGGNYNTFVGTNAGDGITSGDSNVFLGAAAGALIQEGSNNIGIGYEALYNSDTSGNNIAIGTSALKLLDVAGSSNTATDNIAIGHTAGASLTSGTKNIIIGSGSLAADNPSNQIRIGHADLHIISGSLTTGDVIFYNTASAPNFSGSFQGDGSNLTGITATAGSTSGRVVFTTTDGALTTESGFEYNTSTNQLSVDSLNVIHLTSSFITASIIKTSGSNIFGDDTTDTQTLIGTTKMTGSAQITGSTSILGALAITGISDVSASIAAASSAFPFTGDAQITGSLTISGSLIPGGRNKLNTNNVVIGRAAGENMSISTTAGIDNTLIGAEAGNDLTNGNNNVLIGYKAGEYLTTSQDVIAIGKNAIGADGTAGNALNYVIAIGSSAGGRLQGGDGTGDDNYGIYIGRNAGINIDSNDGNGNNILIGHRNVGPSSQGHFGEGHLRIGQGTDSNAVIFPISASLTTGSVLIPQLKVDSVNTANSASGTTLSVEGSGSTVFEVIGSEGTLFSVDDDLDGTIFTANDRTGNPVLQASASGEVYIGKAPQSLYTTAVISSTTAATTQSIFGLSTSSYGGAFFDYTVHSGSNARAGSIMSVWNGGNISFTETTTTDIGDTTDFNVIVHISQSQAQIASHASRAGYNIKTIIRSI